MTKPLSEQQEAFCRYVVEGMSQTDAYEAAGYKGSRKQLGDNASRLIENDRITHRIAELRHRAEDETQITKEWLIGQAKEVLAQAQHDRSHNACIAAIKEIGVLTGHRVERRDNTNRNAASVEEFTTEELNAMLREGLAKDGLSDGNRDLKRSGLN